MDFEKLKQWMEFAQKYQSGDFWNKVFDSNSPQFMKDIGLDFDQKPGARAAAPATDFPKIDIYQSNTHIIIVAELPGMVREEIRLTLTGDVMILRGIVKPIIMEAAAISNERYYGEFERTVSLPEPAESSLVSARLHNGILVVTYPRSFRSEEPIDID